MLQQLAIRFLFSFERPDRLYRACFVWERIAVYYRPVSTCFVVGDFFLHGVNEGHFVILFHCISKREAVVGTYVSGVQKVMDVIHRTIV